MRKKAIIIAAALALSQLAAAATFHSMVPVGSIPTADPNVIIESWEINITIVPDDFWQATYMAASVRAEMQDFFQFAPMQFNLEPPMNPVTPDNAFSNFFTTAAQFPNTTRPNEDPTYVTDISITEPDLMEGLWTTNDPTVDGAGPTFTIFRFAVTRRAGQPPMTLERVGSIALEIQGESDTLRTNWTPYSFILFQPDVDPCPGDLNGDHVVDLTDLGILLAHYGSFPVLPNTGDLDFDAQIDLTDLGILLAHYGDTCP